MSFYGVQTQKMEEENAELRRKLEIAKKALGSIMLYHEDECEPNIKGLSVTYTCVESCTSRIVRTALEEINK